MTHLDSFESALLTELRRHVAERPTPEPAPAVPAAPRRRPHRVAAAVALTGVAATVATLVLTAGGPIGAPAYAVVERSDGAVVVTVNRLEDADGLEAALAGRGIEASVTFESLDDDEMFLPMSTVDGPYAEAGSPVWESCRLDGAAPALVRDRGEWTLTIPAGSPMMDRPVQLALGSRGAYSLTFPTDPAGQSCFLGSSRWFKVPAPTARPLR